MSFRKIGVVGAGNMGSGIAQKIATEGFEVLLADLGEAALERGAKRIEETLAEGVARKIFRPDAAAAILARIAFTSDLADLAACDLVVEAIFEDLDAKRKLFAELDRLCEAHTILGTNTSSFYVRDLAAATGRPDRVVGLHYFYHPAKNRLVEVVPAEQTSEQTRQLAWAFQERIGKTPIHSADAPGFVVNRYFVPWLNEAVRLLEEGVAEIATIDAAAKQRFGIGMGPFELMNVTGVPIALHAATTLGKELGPFYAPSARLAEQVAAKQDWDLAGTPDEAAFEAVGERLFATIALVACELVQQEVATIEDTDIGARVGLRWAFGPFEMMNAAGVAATRDAVGRLLSRWEPTQVPALLESQAATGKPFPIRLVRSEIEEGIATLTINRPDALNALNPEVVRQLTKAFHAAAIDPEVRAIVLAGSGKAFVAGADLKFFVDALARDDFASIHTFTRQGQDLLLSFAQCPKPVIAWVDGLSLGGGSEMALACDWIVASPRGSMGFPETGIGDLPGPRRDPAPQPPLRRGAHPLLRALGRADRRDDREGRGALRSCGRAERGTRDDPRTRGASEAHAALRPGPTRRRIVETRRGVLHGQRVRGDRRRRSRPARPPAPRQDAPAAGPQGAGRPAHGLGTHRRGRSEVDARGLRTGDAEPEGDLLVAGREGRTLRCGGAPSPELRRSLNSSSGASRRARSRSFSSPRPRVEARWAKTRPVRNAGAAKTCARPSSTSIVRRSSSAPGTGAPRAGSSDQRR